MEPNLITYRQALDDFKKARSKAALQRFWSGIQGKSLDLLPFDEISTKLHAISKTNRVLRVVKLDNIIGSVGRTEDFDRNFNPLRDSDINRWAGVKTAMVSIDATGLPPVELYQLGEAYFVLDGNHRVSIAKDMGMDEIEAYVTTIHTKVPLKASVTPEELVILGEYADFLQETRIDQFLPDVNLSMNIPKNYDLLKEHISVHRYYMGLEQNRDVPYDEAVRDWYERVYAPVAETIRSSGLQEVYKDLSVTDLYLWLLDHQSILQEELGIPIQTGRVADFIALQEGKTIDKGDGRGVKHIEDTLTMNLASEVLDAEEGVPGTHDCLFRDILVALSDYDENWSALEQAILLSHCQGGNIWGLHVIDENDTLDQATHDAMRARFDWRLGEAGINGKFLFTTGEISSMVTEYSLLSDLLVLRQIYAPGGTVFERFGSGISAILRNSRRPVLIVKEQAVPLRSVLLSYDGSARSKEGLFVAAYLAARHGSQLHIFSLDNGVADFETEVSFAKTYLRKLGIAYGYTIRKGENFVDEVLEMIGKTEASLLVLGGFSGNSIFERLFGSAMDPLLAQVEIPVLFCQ